MTDLTLAATLAELKERQFAGTAPALLVCLAAPAFFVLLLPWLGWLLLAAGVGAAWLMERGRVRAPGPSLTRDLSLIALGMLIVSAISLEAKLDDLSMLRFTLALGGAVVVPYAVSRWLYRDRAIAFVIDATHRFIHPAALELEGDVPQASVDARLATLIRVVLRTLATGVI